MRRRGAIYHYRLPALLKEITIETRSDGFLATADSVLI